MNITAATPSPEPAAGLSQTSRIVNVFWSPAETFSDIRRNPSWWAAWLLISVFSLIFVFAMQQKVGFAQVMQNEMRSNPKASEQYDKMTPDQRAVGATMTKVLSYSAPVFVLVFAAITAGVLLGVFNFGLGTEVSYGISLAIVFYSMVPGILKSILAAISLYAGADPESFNANNPAATNLGFFISRADHPALFTLASFVDIFGIWMVILQGIGFSTVSKVKRSTAIAVTATCYGLFALLISGIALLRS